MRSIIVLTHGNFELSIAHDHPNVEMVVGHMVQYRPEFDRRNLPKVRRVCITLQDNGNISALYSGDRGDEVRDIICTMEAFFDSTTNEYKLGKVKFA